jgi:hypothetical protein
MSQCTPSTLEYDNNSVLQEYDNKKIKLKKKGRQVSSLDFRVLLDFGGLVL